MFANMTQKNGYNMTWKIVLVVERKVQNMIVAVTQNVAHQSDYIKLIKLW